MANETAGFGGLNLFYLVIMSELTIECVNSLCSQVCEFFLDDQWKYLEWTVTFNVQQSRVMCKRSEDFFYLNFMFQANGIAGQGGLN